MKHQITYKPLHTEISVLDTPFLNVDDKLLAVFFGSCYPSVTTIKKKLAQVRQTTQKPKLLSTPDIFINAKEALIRSFLHDRAARNLPMFKVTIALHKSVLSL